MTRKLFYLFSCFFILSACKNSNSDSSTITLINDTPSPIEWDNFEANFRNTCIKESGNLLDSLATDQYCSCAAKELRIGMESGQIKGFKDVDLSQPEGMAWLMADTAVIALIRPCHQNLTISPDQLKNMDETTRLTLVEGCKNFLYADMGAAFPEAEGICNCIVSKVQEGIIPMGLLTGELREPSPAVGEALKQCLIDAGVPEEQLN